MPKEISVYRQPFGSGSILSLSKPLVPHIEQKYIRADMIFEHLIKEGWHITAKLEEIDDE